ncbi:MAG: hypothetical protein IK026_00735 [Eubacteriaceae bacterium]|nr:hypothetical protein [Eubacteriaceae bacterium]
MKNTITRKDIGYFECLYAGYLKEYYPEAYEQFIAREDHIDLLKKYHVYYHEHMTLLLEILRNDAGFGPRKDFREGLQQDLYERIIAKTKRFVFEGLTDLLAEASWMSA